MDYGLEAVKDIREGDLICSISRKVMMSFENIKNSPLEHLFKNDPILSNMGNVALALFLILEYLKGKDSFWYSYISSLPTSYNTVLYFELDDFLEMQHSPTFGKHLFFFLFEFYMHLRHINFFLQKSTFVITSLIISTIIIIIIIKLLFIFQNQP